MKAGPNNKTRKKITPSSSLSSLSSSLPFLPNLPPSALQWSTAASTAAAISYADRGTSAIAASSLLDELHWSEGQLGDVQSAFFLGYALTQVLGGLLGGSSTRIKTTTRTNKRVSDDGSAATEATVSAVVDNNHGGDIVAGPSSSVDKTTGGYRTVLPLSLFFTGLITLLFPLAAISGGPYWASVDRFCLGLLEGLLLPAAMAGVSDTTTISTIKTATNYGIINDDEGNGSDCGDSNNKATASAIVIAGCYLGSAWAYLSAFFLFGADFQIQVAEWGYEGPIWPWVFYVNGILSLICLLFFREEFNLVQFFGEGGSNLGGQSPASSSSYKGNTKCSKNDFSIAKTNTTVIEGLEATPAQSNLWKDTISIAKSTIASKSGRAILAAQIGQGALLSSIASWGPLYLERVNAVVPPTTDVTSSLSSDAVTTAMTSSVSSVAVTASIAASSLILPQLTQAFVGVTIGATADRLSTEGGTQITRRALQLISGVGPAAVLWYLTREVGVGEMSGVGGSGDLLTPVFLFGMAQTISALSLGAVSVSHLDVATPSSAGAVYALGNVAAAASGSLMVNIFGRMLEDGTTGMGPAGASSGIDVVGAAEFALPFRIVAVLSAVGSLIYGCTVETVLEIGSNGTAPMI